MAANDLMTPAQLADKYPVVSRSLIYAACQDRELRHYRLPARKGSRGKYAIREQDFVAWLEAHRVEEVADGGELKYLR